MKGTSPREIPFNGVCLRFDSNKSFDEVVSSLLADVGSIDELRTRGIRYVAVSKTDYGRFFRQTHKPTKSGLADYERRKKFYERLFREGELLWECKAGLLPVLQQQHIRLYYLPSENRHESRRTNMDFSNDFSASATSMRRQSNCF